jgi:hypothetical protein
MIFSRWENEWGHSGQAARVSYHRFHGSERGSSIGEISAIRGRVSRIAVCRAVLSAVLVIAAILRFLESMTGDPIKRFTLLRSRSNLGAAQFVVDD